MSAVGVAFLWGVNAWLLSVERVMDRGFHGSMEMASIAARAADEAPG